MSMPRILIAGVGNIFLGDDAFGVEVSERLLRRKLPDEVRVIDFGIRGMDLSYALLDGYETVILVDAAARGEPPGTLYVIEPEWSDDVDSEPLTIEAHSMNPLNVLRLARSLGGPASRLLLIACEPSPIDEQDIAIGMTEPVAGRVDEAVELVEALVTRILNNELPVQSPATAAK